MPSNHPAARSSDVPPVGARPDSGGGSAARLQIAELIAQARRGPDPRPQALARMRRTRLDIEGAAPMAMWRVQLAEVLHDALAREVSQRAMQLEVEYRALTSRLDVLHIEVRATEIVFELAHGQESCFLHLAPHQPVRLHMATETAAALPATIEGLLTRRLLDGRLNAIVDELSIAAGMPNRECPAARWHHQEAAPFVSVLLAPWMERLEAARSELAAAHSAIDDLERRWRSALAQEMALHRELFDHAVAPSRESEDLTVLDRLLSFAGVARVMVEDGCLLVHTTPIELITHGIRYQLGCYLLRLDVNGQRIEVRSLESANRNGIDHPHVSHGVPCFGRHAPQVRALWACQDLVGLVRFLLAFLSSYDAGSAYLSITNWPHWQPDSLGHLT